MAQRYIAFDVETPNFANDRMSAIGVSVVEGGAIVQEFYTLVDPEARFDRFNMALTGITPEDVAGGPPLSGALAGAGAPDERWPAGGPQRPL